MDGMVSLTGGHKPMADLIASNAALDATQQVPRTMPEWRMG